MSAAVVVLTTCPNEEEAQLLATELVEQKLAACVQASAINSTYRWQGEIESAPEIRMMIKTTEERFGTVEACIKTLSSYETPEVICLPVSSGSAEYLDWISSEVSLLDK